MPSEDQETIEERIDTVDEITLEEYTHVAEIEGRVLFTPENTPEEWVDNIQMYLEGQLSNLPVAVEVTARERERDD